MEILIGRLEATGQLGLIIDGKNCKMGKENEVPLSVSRCKIQEKRAHCALLIGTSGKMKLINLNPHNVTYVNGSEIDTKIVDETSVIELGADQYRLNLKALLKNIGYEKPYSIKHLARIWQNYDEDLLQMQLNQQKSQNQQKLQGILSQASMLCVIIPSVIPSIPIPTFLRVILVVGALAMSVYFFIKGGKTDDSFVMKKRELDAAFREEYVCPKCGKFLGFQPFDQVKEMGGCTKCKCKYV